MADSCEAIVTAVAADAPAARAGLQPGDRIVAAQGQPFERFSASIDVADAGPPEAIGRAIEACERAPIDRKLRLAVRRGETELALEFELPIAGDFADGLCRQVVATQRADGSWGAPTGQTADRFITGLLALTLLAHDGDAHLPVIRKAVAYLVGPDGKCLLPDDFTPGPGGLDNWPLLTTAFLLAEMRIATGDESLEAPLQRLCDAFAARMRPDGKMGHTDELSYGGNGFNAINTQVHLAWALGRLAGCTIHEAAWQKSLELIQASTGENGGVRYWTLETGYADASARTGSMAAALALAGREPALARRMAGYLVTHTKRMREAHAMGSIGMIYGTFALKLLSAEGWRTHFDEWSWYLTLMRQPDGSAAYLGSKGNNGGDHYLGDANIAAAIAGLMLATREERLRLCGGTRAGWLPVATPLLDAAQIAGAATRAAR
ncbi:MAG: hypothetical protein FJ293_03995 [Planctomycetes bacterium]|nr:hypothetical protein [Planctomycetota bacterium]